MMRIIRASNNSTCKNIFNSLSKIPPSIAKSIHILTCTSQPKLFAQFFQSLLKGKVSTLTHNCDCCYLSVFFLKASHRSRSKSITPQKDRHFSFFPFGNCSTTLYECHWMIIILRSLAYNDRGDNYGLWAKNNFSNKSNSSLRNTGKGSSHIAIIPAQMGDKFTHDNVCRTAAESGK